MLLAYRMRKRLLPVFSVFVVVGILVLLSHCAAPEKVTEPHQEYMNLSDTVQYVGSETCKGCHSAIYESFAKTGMGQSFGPPTKSKSSGNFEGKVLYDSFANLHYQPYWKGDSLYLKEYRLKDGDTVFTRKEKVHYIVGSGHHTNSHITSTHGYLHQMPFTYYTQKGVLSLPPGFENGNNSRYSRALGMECLSCHNGYPDHVEGSFNKFEKVPLGIDCERCHGPGETHVKLKQEGVMVDVGREIDYSIVNPAKLPYSKQKDLCQRCHLQGNAILKDGKNWDDFKPGMDLNEVANVFMPKLKDDEGVFIMAAHPDRLALSDCFTESAQRDDVASMTCITCHNPHQSVRETKMEYFNTKCIDCHQQKQVHSCVNHSASTNCIDCHMQKSGTVDIPHVTVTDHYIRVYDEANTEAISHPADQEFTGLVCLTSEKVQPWLMAQAYLNFYEKFERKQAFLDSADKYLKPVRNNKEHAALSVQYAFLTQDYAGLRNLYRGVAKELQDAQSLYRMSTGFETQQPGHARTRIALLEAAVNQMPLRLDMRNELAIAYLQTGSAAKAKKELDFILKEFPKDEKALNTLGFYYLINAEMQLAENMFAKVLQLNPDHENALINMSKISISRNDFKMAKTWLRRALVAHPKSRDARVILAELNR